MGEIAVRHAGEHVAVTDTAEQQVFVTMYVDRQLFGIPVDRVQDILVPERIARIPLASEEVAGAINLRGRIVTVIDVRVRLGLPRIKSESRRMCCTVELGNELYSLMVDSVGSVLELPMNRIEQNPTTLDQRWRNISKGVVRLEKELVVLLDIDALLDFAHEQARATSLMN